MLCLPEDLKIVEGLAPQVGAAAAVTGDYVSLKTCHKAYVVIHYNQGDATDVTWHVKRATAVAPTGAIAVTEALNIWSNLDCATSDLLVKRTAAINYASGAGATHKQVILEVDPAALAVGFDCIAGCSTTAIAATSWVQIMYYLVPRYRSGVANQPSAIVD